MPCYSVNTVSLDFKTGDRALLAKAAASLGLVVEYGGGGQQALYTKGGDKIAVLAGGKAQVAENLVPVINKLRVAYSKEIVNAACLKMGWQKMAKTDNKLKLTKGV